MGLKTDEIYAILSRKIEGISLAESAIVYRGSVDSELSLPSSPQVGDMYNITAESTYGPAGTNVAWTGTQWNPIGTVIDASALEPSITVTNHVIQLSESGVVS